MAEFSSLNGYQVKDAVARGIAKGRNQAVAFVDYATMIETLNGLEKDEYKAGQNVYIGVVGVPDLWVYSVEDIRHTFIYESDDDIVEKLKNNTTIQAGFFKLAMLEGQKVDLTTYDQHLTKHDDDIAKNVTDIETINDNLGGIKFGVDASGKYGYYKVGADTVTPFKTTEVISLGSGTSFNVTAYEGYKNFTTANFLYKLVAPSGTLTTSATTANNGQNTATSGTVTTTVSESYSNGVYKVTIKEALTVQPWANDGASTSRSLTVKAYLILK